METEEIQDVEMTEEQAANAIAGLLDQQQPAGAEEANPDGEVHQEPTEEVETAAEEAEEEVSEDTDSEEEELSIETFDQLAEALGAESTEDLNDILVKVKVDGKEAEVPFSELKAGYQKEAHVTRKSQKLTEKTQAIEGYEAQLLNIRDHFATLSKDNPWAAQEQQLHAEWNSTNWDELEQEDPIEANTRQNRLNRAFNNIQQQKAAREESLNQAIQQLNHAEIGMLQKQGQQLLEATGWEPEEVETKQQEMASFLAKEYGASPAAISSVRYSAIGAALNELMQLKAQQGVKKDALEKKTVKKTVRVLKPGARRTALKGQGAKYKSLYKRAQSTQSDDDWSVALAEKLGLN